MTEVSLELVGLSRRFGSVVALDGLTFSVPPGEVFGFLGPNGAGKTTTMRAIFGVLALEAGQVCWQGPPAPGSGCARCCPAAKPAKEYYGESA